ncbi:MAG: T9SS type A sorting domain-containing protein [Opitutaceae bacterium]|nr:T9SS type A sorting domain-containing protein [Cytophagales bacterium]
MIKKYLLILCLFCIRITDAQNLITTVEAETGTLTGVTIASQTGNSSGSYVTGFDASGDKVTVALSVPSAGLYKVVVTYRANQGQKTQDLFVNGTSNGSLSFPASTNFTDLDAGGVYLNKGSNTLAIVNNWGYMDVDKFTVYTSARHTYNLAASLIDPSATASVKNLYNFMKCQFGKKIISGQTDDYFDNLKTIAGRTPMLRAFDFQHYSAGYPYKWANGGSSFGADPNNQPEAAIAWYNSTNKKGIVSFQWHWHSPSGGTVGTNTFYTASTTFDVREAVKAGTQQNKDIIRDIDAIAVELKKLRDANVPVVWRPLHEAGGGWFWWGAKGAAPCKALYDIIYDRITNYHGIHNLIWSWSSPEADWYPGNSKVDLLGYDSYPGDYNYTTQKSMFDKLYTIVKGEKLIGMTENGPIPDIQLCFDMDAPWSYFMSWGNLVSAQNSAQHIKDVYANTSVLSIENSGSNCVITALMDEQFNSSDLNQMYCAPNPFTYELQITGQGEFEYTISNLGGIKLEEGQGNESKQVGSKLLPGIYLLKLTSGDKTQILKVVKQ